MFVQLTMCPLGFATGDLRPGRGSRDAARRPLAGSSLRLRAYLGRSHFRWVTSILSKKKNVGTPEKDAAIFRDPYGSLNPRMTIRDIILEPLEVRLEKDREDRVMGLLEQVGLEGAYAERYPHQLSGGQHQRVVIARALALNPKFIVCDEPVSALDVSIQSQLLNLLEDLQKKLGLTYLFIAHNLSVVKHASHRIGVMYLGKMLELAGEREICENPLHPYTRALLAAVPVPDPDASRELVVLEGEIPNAINPPSGCRFHPRCAAAREECKVLEPEWKEVSTGIGLLVIFVMSCRYRCRCGTWYLL